MSDLKYLLHRQQMELRHAQEAQCVEARRSHQGLAKAYALRIDDCRRNMTPATA